MGNDRDTRQGKTKGGEMGENRALEVQPVVQMGRESEFRNI